MHNSSSTAAAGRDVFFFFCVFSKKFSLSLSPVISPTPPRACAFRIPPIDGSPVTEFSCLVPPYCNFSVWLDIRLHKADGPPETLLSASELIHVLCPVISVSIHSKRTPYLPFSFAELWNYCILITKLF